MADPCRTAPLGIAKLNAGLPMLSQAATLELCWLLGGARDVIRLSCGSFQAPFLVSSLQEHGLSIRRWNWAFVPRVQDCIGSYMSGSWLSENLSAPGAQQVLFVARDPELAGAAAQAGLDDVALGRLLGYPECCIRSYVAHRQEYLLGFAPCFSAGRGPWPWWSNVALEPFGWILVSHFPCTPDCVPTRHLAARHLETVRRADPWSAELLEENLRSLTVWHPALGVLAAREALPRPGGDLRLGLVKVTGSFRALAGEGRGLHLRGDALLDRTGRVLAEGLAVADHRGEAALAAKPSLERRGMACGAS